MPNISISEQLLLEKCREVELLCKELYNCFAELYSGNVDAVRLWSKTAMEEQNHADQFTLALKLNKSLPCVVTVKTDRVESVIAQLLATLAKVKEYPPKHVEALRFAIKIEKCLADFHLGCVVIFEDDSYRKMFNAMMASDQDHIESLQADYDKLSESQDWSFTG